ncbi:hypothetical protein BU24DRAFT_426477 [Aaosphaeria arxii CBS 175.79]|uniref:DUF3176 domain-containing protein n=1 Tax=Aaosphaeria arxii CBS 175.79 TaxID=1450172 RepID=A0A6A5XEW2_9PLEO|nr:uncharacterized protein BU24DRAFT_426477 [Aaosphaeria arxii CBS 175.79]KAF2011399.1 hypothetical protein BU24DRAFT_426477 [Aaosphaeria arxii CBS 175.79]
MESPILPPEFRAPYGISNLHTRTDERTLDNPLPPPPYHGFNSFPHSSDVENPPFVGSIRSEHPPRRSRLANLRRLYRRRVTKSRISGPFTTDKIDQQLGLGIIDGLPMHHDQSSGQAKDASVKSRINAAQWIEKMIFQYTTSGGVTRRWTLEIISWCVSALCMGAIIGILIAFQDTEMPDWPIGQIFNILSKVASAALILPVSEALGQLKWDWFQGESRKMWDFEIFDNASRGPWGSALLLVRTKGRTLASLGAAVTLLALALDPFFQQVIDFPQHWVAIDNSTIPRILHLDLPYRRTYFNGTEMSTKDSDVTNLLKSFFFDKGTKYTAFGNGTRPEIPVFCPTSNCTWPVYETMAVCSACTDVTELLEFACLKANLDWTTTSAASAKWDPVYQKSIQCGYFLNATSENPVLMTGYMVEPGPSYNGTLHKETLLMRTLPLAAFPRKEALYGGSIHYSHVRNPIIDFIVASTSGGKEAVHQNSTAIAYECMLTWCVQSIQSTYHRATYKEEIVNEFINTTSGPWPWKTEGYYWDDIGWAANQEYTQNITLKPHDDGPEFGLSNNTAYNINGVFDDLAPSYYIDIDELPEPIMRSDMAFSGPETTQIVYFNPWIAPNNITNHVKRLSEALSYLIRSRGSPESIVGVAWNEERFVSVTWPWLTLPLCILILSAFFLAGTVYKTAKDGQGIGVWKTSAMAALLHGGISEDMQKKMKDPQSTTETLARARKLKARLLPGQGWRISGAIFSPKVPATKEQHTPGWI